MELTLKQVQEIVGAKELEIHALRFQVEELQKKLAEKAAPPQ